MPKQVLQLLSAQVVADSQAKSNTTVFVSVDLLIESPDLDTAQEFEPPIAFLNKVLAELLNESVWTIDMKGRWTTLMALEPNEEQAA
jgi:hypothetical protein